MDTLLEQYVINGGVMMVLLVPCSLLMLAAVLQGMIGLRRGRMLPKRLFLQARQVRTAAEREAFVEKLGTLGYPLARAVWLTLHPLDWRQGQPDAASLRTRCEEAVAEVSDELYDRLGMLGTIYTIAPYLGIMGTVLGMMHAFYEFGVLKQKSIETLSVGIQQALVTTLWGLGIAIPAFIGARWLQSRIRTYERHRLPSAVTRLITDLYAGGDETVEVSPAVTREKTGAGEALAETEA